MEPEGEALVDLEGEALRPPGITMVYSPTHLLAFFCKYLGNSPLTVFLCIKGLFWSLGELVEDEGNGQEPEVYAKRQMEFDWGCTWLWDGGMPALAEDKAQGLLSQLFLVFPGLLLSYFILVFCSLHSASDLGFNAYLFFFHFVFQGVWLLQWANVLKQEADCLQLEANQLEAEGLQQIEFAVVGSGTEAFYDII